MVLFQIESQFTEIGGGVITCCHGITKDPETNSFMIVMHPMNGSCKECGQPNSDLSWCQSCNAKHFQQNFKNWTSGNPSIDEFIQKTQLKAKCPKEVLEWIDYNRFEDVEYLAKGRFGTVHKAIWKDGSIYCWDSVNNQWIRSSISFTYIGLPNSTNITVEIIKVVGLFFP